MLGRLSPKRQAVEAKPQVVLAGQWTDASFWFQMVTKRGRAGESKVGRLSNERKPKTPGYLRNDGHGADAGAFGPRRLTVATLYFPFSLLNRTTAQLNPAIRVL